MEATVGTVGTRPCKMPAGHAELPVWNAENRLCEDWQPGRRTRSLRRTITEGGLILDWGQLQAVNCRNPGDVAGKIGTTS